VLKSEQHCFLQVCEQRHNPGAVSQLHSETEEIDRVTSDFDISCAPQFRVI
jgi:hypothetical protein